MAMRTKEQAPKCCPPAEGVSGRSGGKLACDCFATLAMTTWSRGCRQGEASPSFVRLIQVVNNDYPTTALASALSA